MFTFAYMDRDDSELMVVQCSNDADSLELAYDFSHRFHAVSGSYFGDLDSRQMAELVLRDGFQFVNGDDCGGKKPRKFMKTIRDYYGF